MKCLPFSYKNYWVSLMLASIFGANAGDFIADVLGLGHANGLPILFLCLGATFVFEFVDDKAKIIYYWIAIIIIRSAATNMGDIFHDFDIPFKISTMLSLCAVIASLFLWKMFGANSLLKNTIPLNAFYFITMFFAGVAGTVVGDAFSYGLELGNLYAALTLGFFVGLAFFLWNDKLKSNLSYYWITVVLIRSAGTAAGDFIANTDIGLTLSTLITGAVFVLVTVFFRKKYLRVISHVEAKI
nr:hypothetical protein [uncultured Tolumonas sp.]